MIPTSRARVRPHDVALGSACAREFRMARACPSPSFTWSVCAKILHAAATMVIVWRVALHAAWFRRHGKPTEGTRSRIIVYATRRGRWPRHVTCTLKLAFILRAHAVHTHDSRAWTWLAPWRQAIHVNLRCPTNGAQSSVIALSGCRNRARPPYAATRSELVLSAVRQGRCRYTRGARPIVGQRRLTHAACDFPPSARARCPNIF